MQTDFTSLHTDEKSTMHCFTKETINVAPPPGFEGIQPNKKGYNTEPIPLLTLSTLSTLSKQFTRLTKLTEPIPRPPQLPTEFHPVFPTLSLQAVNLLEDTYDIPTLSESNVYRRNRIEGDWWQMEM